MEHNNHFCGTFASKSRIFESAMTLSLANERKQSRDFWNGCALTKIGSAAAAGECKI